MANKVERLKEELKALLSQGDLLIWSMGKAENKLPKDFQKQLIEDGIDLPTVRYEYETWYSESLRVIKQVIPERLDDFMKQYKDEKRKFIANDTYTVYDYLIGIHSGMLDLASAIPKLQNQVAILRSAYNSFNSSLFHIKEIIQADIFDSELDAAKELCRKGFLPASGAMVGVVLEKHLSHVCTQNNIPIKKKNPTIADLNNLLKDNVIDIEQWRFIERLGDLRNRCTHRRDREPTQENVDDLIEGVDKVIKTVF